MKRIAAFGFVVLGRYQRESGRWFTRSLNTDKYHFITHAGTACAVMALKACEWFDSNRR